LEKNLKRIREGKGKRFQETACKSEYSVKPYPFQEDLLAKKYLNNTEDIINR